MQSLLAISPFVFGYGRISGEGWGRFTSRPIGARNITGLYQRGHFNTSAYLFGDTIMESHVAFTELMA